MRGYPQIVSQFTTASADDALAVLHAKVDACPAGEIMRRILEMWSAPATCVWEPTSKRTFGTTDWATREYILAAWAADLGPELVLEPVPGIVGVNLPWQVVSDTLGNLDLNDKLANGFQRRTFYGLVNTALSAYRLATFPAILVDQVNAVVKVKATYGTLATMLEDLEPVLDTICVEFIDRGAVLAFE